MKKIRAESGGHVVDVLFTLALFCVLAASALMVVLIGANVYKNTVKRMDQNFSASAALTYISNKIRQNDISGAVSISETEGAPALVLEHVYNESAFQTWIYHDDGALKEVLVHKGDSVSLGDGIRVVEVESFSISEEGNGVFLFTSRNEDGESTSLLVGVRSDTTQDSESAYN